MINRRRLARVEAQIRKKHRAGQTGRDFVPGEAYHRLVMLGLLDGDKDRARLEIERIEAEHGPLPPVSEEQHRRNVKALAELEGGGMMIGIRVD